MSVPEAAVEAAAMALRESRLNGRQGLEWGSLDSKYQDEFRKSALTILEATLPSVLAPVLALHPKSCEINGDDTDCKEDECPMLVCGPCGEDWPCPTVKALTE